MRRNAFFDVARRLLGTTAITARSPVLPNTATVAEQGLPGFNVVGWAGLFVRAGTPEAIVNKISEALKKVYATGELQQQLGSKGMDVLTTAPREFAKFVSDDRDMWREVIRAQKIKVQ